MNRIILLSFLIFTLATSYSNAEWLGWKRLIDGETFDIAVNPKNPNTIIVGGGGRIYYRSYDGGKNWIQDTLLHFPEPSSRFNNVILSPVDTNILIIGGLGVGSIYTSTDQGQTWLAPYTRVGNGFELNGKSLMFKPDAPDTVYFGDFNSGEIYRSTNSGRTWDSLSTVYTDKYFDVMNVEHDTIIPTTVGSTGIREDSTNILLMGSTSAEMFMSKDGGVTWKSCGYLIRPDSGQWDSEITRITFSNRDPLTGYCCITYLFPTNKNNGGLYKTIDGGYTWKQMAFPDTSIWAVACRGLGKDDEVFMGGYTESFYAMDSVNVPGSGIVRRSQDGGKTWWAYDGHIDWFDNQPNTNSVLNSICFSGKDTGYVVGGYGDILKTTDGGNNWYYLISPDNNYLFHSVFFNTSKVGFVAGDNGVILKTVYGGSAWTKLDAGTSNNLYSLYFSRIDSGFVVGDNGTILATYDGGLEWTPQNSHISTKLASIVFTDKKIGYTAGDSGVILKTTDRGNSWFQLATATNANLHSIYFPDSSNGFACGDKSTLLKTTDAGISWFPVNIKINRNFNCITFPTDNIGWIVGDSGLVLKSTDSGLNWIQQEPRTVRNLKFVYFMDSDSGFSCGSIGFLNSTKNGGKYWNYNEKGSGPKANMWSLRFLGEKGKEKLYMATEGGLFVLDYPSYVEEFEQNILSSRLDVLLTPDNSLLVTYKMLSSDLNTPLTFRLTNLLGDVILEQHLPLNGNSIINDYIYLPNIPKGLYVCQVIEQGVGSTKIIIIE